VKDLLQRVVAYGTSLGAEFVDVRVQDTVTTDIALIDGVTRRVTIGRDRGAGFRAFIGGAWGFACTNDLSEEGLRTAVERAVKLALAAKERVKQPFKLAEYRWEEARVPAQFKENPLDVAAEDKVRFLLEQDKEVKAMSDRIVNRNFTYNDAVGTLIVCNSEGCYVELGLCYIYARALIYAHEAGVTQFGYERHAGAAGFELTREEKAVNMGREAAEQALRLVKALPPPAGRFTVVLDPEMTGLFTHEAFGHCSEADHVLEGLSVLEGRVGCRVGSELVTIIDDPTVGGLYGHFIFDHEGVRAKPHRIVDRGILIGFMHSLETAGRMGVEPNGAARAESYRVEPIIRMSNTYIAAGDWSLEEMLKDMREGMLIKGGWYGYVETGKGVFTFKARETYRVEKGEITTLHRDAAISGLTLEVLMNIDAVGKEVKYGPGHCGKDGQWMRVTDGGPHIRVKNMVVGGAL